VRRPPLLLHVLLLLMMRRLCSCRRLCGTMRWLGWIGPGTPAAAAAVTRASVNGAEVGVAAGQQLLQQMSCAVP
jgi:hypothetical protein